MLDHFQLVDNSLFEVDADWTFDNPLFELGTKDLSYSHDEDDPNQRTWDPIAVPNTEFGLQD